MEDVAEPHDQFGWALAAANFGGGSHADLAIAANFETLESAVGTKHGAVNVIYGSASGLSATATPDQFWSQDSPSVNDLAEDVDVFGRSLAAANFGGVGSQADLAIGIPFEFLPNAGGFEGAVEVIYGSASGLSATATPDQFWNQDSPGINNAAEFDDEFGIALAGIT